MDEEVRENVNYISMLSLVSLFFVLW